MCIIMDVLTSQLPLLLILRGGGGSKANFFGVPDLSFGHHVQVPLIIRETFGEILGPRRPTVSEPRPAQKLGVK